MQSSLRLMMLLLDEERGRARKNESKKPRKMQSKIEKFGIQKSPFLEKTLLNSLKKFLFLGIFLFLF